MNQLIERFNIPKVHKSGIRVDLGDTYEAPNASGQMVKWRQVAGECPVFGKRIILGTGNSFLLPPKEGDPPGGGFGFPEYKNVLVKPSPISLKAEKWKDQLDECLGHSKAICRIDDSDSLIDGAATACQQGGYHFPTYFDAKNNICHLLYFHWQAQYGDTYCDNNGGGAKMYCFNPEKSISVADNAYFSWKVPQNTWKDNCPNEAIRGLLMGKHDGSKCILPFPRAVLSGLSFSNCMAYLFHRSSSDQPVAYESRQATDILKDIFTSFSFKSLLSIFDTSDKRAYSHGDGINYVNYSPRIGCWLFDSPPDCFIKDKNAISATALSNPRKMTAMLPPCSKEFADLEVDIGCDCLSSSRERKYCTRDGTWQTFKEPCACSLLWGSISGAIGLLVAIIAGFLIYRCKSSLTPEEVSNTTFRGGGYGDERIEELQEVDGSFWDDSSQNMTGVIIDNKPEY